MQIVLCFKPSTVHNEIAKELVHELRTIVATNLDIRHIRDVVVHCEEGSLLDVGTPDFDLVVYIEQQLTKNTRPEEVANSIAAEMQEYLMRDACKCDAPIPTGCVTCYVLPAFSKWF